MTVYQALIILFVCAFSGWLIASITIGMLFKPAKPVGIGSFKIQGIVPAFQQQFAKEAGKYAQEEFLRYRGLEDKLADPALLAVISPEVEKHVDHFLQVKIKTVFPILAQFMGEKTINQFKTALLEEIDNLFPVLMSDMASHIKAGTRLDMVVEEKLNQWHPGQFEELLLNKASKHIRLYKLLCTSVGILTGIVIILTLIISGI